MDLQHLTMGELAVLKAGLDAVIRAAARLEDGGFSVEVTLGDGETVLRAGAILGARALPAPGDAVIDVEPVADAAVPGVEIAAMPPAPKPAPEPAPAAHHPAQPRVVGSDGFVRGSWLPQEDARLRELRRSGATYSQICDELSRPASAIRFRAKVLGLTGPGAVARAGQASAVQEHGAGDTPQSVAPDAGPRSGGAGVVGVVPAAPGPASPPGPPRETPPPAGGPGAGAGADPVPDALRGVARDLWRVIAALPRDAGCDAEVDLEMVEGLARGARLAEIALDLGVDAAVLKKRFAAVSAEIRDARGSVTLIGQGALIDVLRERVKRARGVA